MANSSGRKLKKAQKLKIISAIDTIINYIKEYIPDYDFSDLNIIKTLCKKIPVSQYEHYTFGDLIRTYNKFERNKDDLCMEFIDYQILDIESYMVKLKDKYIGAIRNSSIDSLLDD